MGRRLILIAPDRSERSDQYTTGEEQIYKVVAEPMAQCAHHNAIERLHAGFNRRIKMQMVRPSAGIEAMLSGRCLLSARSTYARSVAGKRLPQSQSIHLLTLPLEAISSC